MKDPTDDQEVRKGLDSQGAEGFHKTETQSTDGIFSILKQASFLCTQQLANQSAHSISQSHTFCLHTHFFNNSFSSASMAHK